MMEARTVVATNLGVSTIALCKVGISEVVANRVTDVNRTMTAVCVTVAKSVSNLIRSVVKTAVEACVAERFACACLTTAALADCAAASVREIARWITAVRAELVEREIATARRTVAVWVTLADSVSSLAFRLAIVALDACVALRMIAGMRTRVAVDACTAARVARAWRTSAADIELLAERTATTLLVKVALVVTVAVSVKERPPVAIEATNDWTTERTICTLFTRVAVVLVEADRVAFV